MWFEQPEACRNAVLEFWREENAKPLTTKNTKEHEGKGTTLPLIIEKAELACSSPRLRVSAVTIPSSPCLRGGFALNPQQPLRVATENLLAIFL
jgi:hypothetical protein